MIVEYIRYTIEEARSEAFVQAYRVAGESLRESPHCLGFELSRCTEEAGAFVLRILWDSAEGHLSGFRRSPSFRRFFAEIRPYVEDIREMRHYALTDVVWERAGEGSAA